MTGAVAARPARGAGGAAPRRGSGFRDLAARGTVHFMGVGGAGMAPLAELVLRSGGRISGCDVAEPSTVRELVAMGMHFSRGHDPAHVDGIAALVVTSAVPPSHPEIAAARNAGIPVLKRAEALGQWVEGKTVVGIAGTHGKTTTTAMATTVLQRTGADPTGVVGGSVARWGGNLWCGKSDLFVVEADEYDRSFLSLSPSVAVVTNVEADHLDTYGDLANIRSSFAAFAQRVAPDGVLWVCADDSGAARVGVEGGSRTRTYGFSAGSQLRAANARFSEEGSTFAVVEDGVPAGVFAVPVPGPHNVRNALAAIGVARALGAGWRGIRDGLAAYPGVGRRYQLLGTAAGVKVIDDYAHHPTEVAATLAAARRSNPNRRLVAVFQPHLFSRTKDFYREFGRALGEADSVWVTDVYPARETPLPGVTGKLVAGAVRGRASRVEYCSELSALPEAVSARLKPGDVCVVMGAGSIETAGPRILSHLMER